MENSIKLLLIEDSQNDCDLLAEHIDSHGYQSIIERVECESDLETALLNGKFDIILCDHNMPSLDVFSALALAKKLAPTTPLIVVSGWMSESAAVQALKAGAKDFVLKDNLSRLMPAIEREILEAEKHVEHLRLEDELKVKQDELLRAQKIEAVGQLAGGISHDFNNILAVILMNAEMAISRIAPSSKPGVGHEALFKNLENIKFAGERGATLTRQLLAFSRKQIIQPKTLDMNESIREMLNLLSRVIEENIAIELDLEESQPKVKMDASHLDQIIMNLVVNSRDAMPQGGTIFIKTRHVDVDEQFTQRGTAEPGRYILLEIADTGIGMSEEVQKRIFEPLFTTKGLGKGTGLGLATVYGVVKQSRGFISLKSEPNKGTTFSIYLPQSDGEVLSVPQPQGTSTFGSETILVVEDEAVLRELVCKSLRKKGYHVLEASNGFEALKSIESSDDSINLVLSDVVMPKMSGRELSDKAIHLQKGLKFLFVSGYTNDVLIQHGVDIGQSHFLEKPFSNLHLHNKIRSVLDMET